MLLAQRSPLLAPDFCVFGKSNMFIPVVPGGGTDGRTVMPSPFFQSGPSSMNASIVDGVGFGAGLGVDAECESRVGVTEPGLDGLEVDACEGEAGGVRLAEAAELGRLQRENERLRARLEQAEMIIDVQKKLSQLLGLTPDETGADEST